MTPSEPAAGAPRPGPVVGVALPVPEPWGQHLQRLRLSYGDLRAQHIPTHITLLPPTPVDLDLLADLRSHLQLVAARQAPFRVLLRGTGTFRPVSDVVYVQVAQGVASCEQLQAAVRSGPVARPLSFPYHPHVTLAHDLPATVLERAFEDLAAFSCSYLADRMRLYRHDGDEVWALDEEFVFTA